MTLGELLKHSISHLSPSSPSPALDAELLMCRVFSCTRSFLYSHPETPVSDAQIIELDKLLTRRTQGEPIAYLLGEQDFWSLTLEVTRDTLIPRPETEHLVAWALTHLPANEALHVADLGTGSGAIAIALAHERPHWTLHATDQSFAALAVAKRNAARYGLDNIIFFQGHWCDALPHQQYDAIISNPPYIAEQDPHLAHLTYEPRTALSAGPSGLVDLTRIAEQAQAYLKPAAVLLMEHGYDQGEAVGKILSKLGYTDVVLGYDFAQHPRFSLGKK